MGDEKVKDLLERGERVLRDSEEKEQSLLNLVNEKMLGN